MKSRDFRPLDAWILRALLGLYPRRFRDTFGEEMLSAYLQKRDLVLQERGSRPRLGLRLARWVIGNWVNTLIEAPGTWQDELEQTTASRPRRGDSLMQSLIYEARLAARSLFTRQRSFTFLCVCTLALGLGATTAIFSVVHGVLLAPLPYGEPERIVRIYEDRWSVFPGPVFSTLRERSQSFEAIAAYYDYRPEGIDFTEVEPAEHLQMLRVGNGYFEALGVRPLLGRTFHREEEIPPGAALRTLDNSVVATEQTQPVVILSHSFWQRSFGGDPATLNSQIELDQRGFTVVGIMPSGLGGYVGGSPDVWLPMDLAPGGNNRYDNYYLSAVARLKPGVTVEKAEAEIERLAVMLRQEPDAAGNLAFNLESLQDVVVGPSRTLLGLLFAAVAAMLAIACINVANLFLARGLGRQRELG